ncbi:MAG: hypothetical protein LBQ60_06795 [Bacteroidales bacterium]|jgi:hypothetical protein|nr:hypothetical protein [Bacteroidales bacterium]
MLHKTRKFIYIIGIIFLFSCTPPNRESASKLCISGIYPHLAYYNNEGECGTGAVVTWADRLWVITYGPHLPFGSSDKLYEISPELEITTRPESVGGTPANRMIHKESNQLFIGPYVVDQERKVRTIPYKNAPGRHTGNARHLTDPENKIYLGTMEEGFYEIDVNDLGVNMLYEDGNIKGKREKGKSGQYNDLLPGCHGKGLYSGQGVLVYSNNGEDSPEAKIKFDIKAGVLAEWNGKDWTIVRRNQFVEVTGPGGIYGNPDPATDPIWATGWDHKSVITGVRDAKKGWQFYRLPKASYSYDGAHGWNTEWPRIRDIGTKDQPDYLMTMHGMFWHFPKTFTLSNSAGIRPRSAYLKVIGDFTRWNDQLVFGCDDAAQKEFLNKRKTKGGIEGPGQSNSNLWFTAVDQPDRLGPKNAGGYVWLNEPVEANIPSEPFLFAGWDIRTAWLKNTGNQTVTFKFETDKEGTGQWNKLKDIDIPAGGSLFLEFEEKEKGEWIRVISDKNTQASVAFVYADIDKRKNIPDPIFKGISTIDQEKSTGGLLYGLGDNRRVMGILAGNETGETGYYEIDERMKIVLKEDHKTTSFIREKFAIPENVVEVEKGSVLVVDDKGRRWRLPLGNEEYTAAMQKGLLRICREVATERDLFNCHGTFYELPAENADGYAKIRPVASHNLKIQDYASYRGLLIISGIDPKKAGKNPHIFISEDKKAAVWAGVIDDLWKLGKPEGKGGPWVDTNVKAGIPSDPYLIGFYDQRQLELSHQSAKMVTFTIEVDPTGDGDWVKYKDISVGPGEIFKSLFPQSFLARWIRFSTDSNTLATAWLEYN